MHGVRQAERQVLKAFGGWSVHEADFNASAKAATNRSKQKGAGGMSKVKEFLITGAIIIGVLILIGCVGAYFIFQVLDGIST